MRLASLRSCMPAKPPVIAPAATTLMAASRAITSSISSNETPRVLCCMCRLLFRPGPETRALLVLEVGVDALAAGLPVLAEEHQVEVTAFARHAVFVRMAERILQLSGLRIGAEPSGGIAGGSHKFVERIRQPASIHAEGFDLAGQRLHRGLAEVVVAAILAADYAAADESQHGTDHHDHDDDLDQAHATLPCGGSQAWIGTQV